MPAQNTHERTTAQIACEAIINHEFDGYTLADMAAVFEVATRERVGTLYVDMLVECITRAVAVVRGEAFPVCRCCEVRADGHGHFGMYCEPCAARSNWVALQSSRRTIVGLDA